MLPQKTKEMKKIIMTLVAAFTMTAAMAQDFGRPGGQPRMNPTEMMLRRTQRMIDRYGLNAEQAEQLKALNEKQMERMGRMGRPGLRPDVAMQDSVDGKKADRKDAAKREQRMQMTPGQRPQRQRPDMTEYNNELKKILTPEQYQAYEEDQAKMRQRK